MIKNAVGGKLPPHLCCAPGMGDNLVVKVHCGLGSRNR